VREDTPVRAGNHPASDPPGVRSADLVNVAAIAEPSLTVTRNIRRRDASASPVRASFMQPWRMARSGQAHTSAVRP